MALWEEQERTIFVLFICKKYSIHIQVFFISLKGNRLHSIISAQGLYFNVTTDGFAFTLKPVLLLTSSFSSKGLHWLDIIFSLPLLRRKWKSGLAQRSLWGQKIQGGFTQHVGAGKGQWCLHPRRQLSSSVFTLQYPIINNSSNNLRLYEYFKNAFKKWRMCWTKQASTTAFLEPLKAVMKCYLDLTGAGMLQSPGKVTHLSFHPR